MYVEYISGLKCIFPAIGNVMYINKHDTDINNLFEIFIYFS